MFYLVLRGLDTVEDDMTIPDDAKQKILRSFHILTTTPGWNFNGSGPDEKDRQLLVEYDQVVEEVNLLDPEYVFVYFMLLATRFTRLNQIQNRHPRHCPEDGKRYGRLCPQSCYNGFHIY